MFLSIGCAAGSGIVAKIGGLITTPQQKTRRDGGRAWSSSSRFRTRGLLNETRTQPWSDNIVTVRFQNDATGGHAGRRPAWRASG